MYKKNLIVLVLLICSMSFAFAQSAGQCTVDGTGIVVSMSVEGKTVVMIVNNPVAGRSERHTYDVNTSEKRAAVEKKVNDWAYYLIGVACAAAGISQIPVVSQLGWLCTATVGMLKLAN
jgi:hypothetical protein